MVTSLTNLALLLMTCLVAKQIIPVHNMFGCLQSPRQLADWLLRLVARSAEQR